MPAIAFDLSERRTPDNAYASHRRGQFIAECDPLLAKFLTTDHEKSSIVR